MVKDEPINCMKCKTQVTTRRSIMYLYIAPPGLRCHKCGELVISVPVVEM